MICLQGILLLNYVPNIDVPSALQQQTISGFSFAILLKQLSLNLKQAVSVKEKVDPPQGKWKDKNVSHLKKFNMNILIGCALYFLLLTNYIRLDHLQSCWALPLGRLFIHLFPPQKHVLMCKIWWVPCYK